MSFFSSSDLLNFLRSANTREVQDVIIELSEHVYIHSVEWQNQPVRLSPEGDTVVEDTYHADYCSSPACTITAVTNDGGIFKIDIKVREEIGIREVKPNETYGLTVTDINAILSGAYRFDIISNELWSAILLSFD